MFDLQEFLKIAASLNIFLVPTVLGIVEWIKVFGVEGKVLNAVSMIVGIAVGIPFMIAALGLPIGFAGWFAYSFNGLAIGLIASGIWKAGSTMSESGYLRANHRGE